MDNNPNNNMRHCWSVTSWVLVAHEKLLNNVRFTSAMVLCVRGNKSSLRECSSASERMVRMSSHTAFRRRLDILFSFSFFAGASCS